MFGVLYHKTGWDFPWNRGAWMAATFLGAWSLTLNAAEPAPAAKMAPVPPENAVGATLRFPALERIDRQEKLEAQRRFEQKRQLQLHDAERLIQLALHKDDADQRILTLLRADRMLRKMQAEKADVRVTRYMENVKRMVFSLPPPKVFENSAGLEFVLVSDADNTFYAARRPVGRKLVERFAAATGRRDGVAGKAPERPGRKPATVKTPAGHELPAFISWDAARAFCAWLSTQEQFSYRLPALDELAAVPWKVGCRLWTRTEWTGPDPASARMRSRFGVAMVLTSEPGTSVRLPELPFARYQGIGFIPVTGTQAGIAARLKRLKGQL